MADDQGSQRREIAKLRNLGDEEHDGSLLRDLLACDSVIDLTGTPDSWVLLYCPNPLVDRYNPAESSGLRNSNTSGTHCPLYVGIDSFTLRPVFACAQVDSDAPELSKTRPLRIKFTTTPSTENHAMVNFIFHQSLCTKGALNLTMSLVAGHVETRDELGCTAFAKACKTQVQCFETGEPIEPIRHPRQAASQPRLSLIPSLSGWDASAAAYDLWLPCLVKAWLTPELLRLAIDIQHALSHDNMHLNEVIMASFVWYDHESDDYRKAEPIFIWGETGMPELPQYVIPRIRTVGRLRGCLASLSTLP